MEIPVVAMIMRSGWVARIVLLILGGFSIVSWTVIFNRALVLSSVQRLHRRFKRAMSQSPHLLDVSTLDARIQRSPMGLLGAAGSGEYHRILEDAREQQRMRSWEFYVNSQFEMANDRLECGVSQGRARLDRGLVLLALMSSASPFLGLFGTVWGVMNSFFEIGNQGGASLPVVAPGIAEALITTIVGLGVAIPAVIFYNYFMHRVERIEEELGDTKERLLIQLKRDVLTQFFAGEGAQV